MASFQARLVALIAIAGLAVMAVSPAVADPEPQFTLGACGGAMTGYDGRQYACDPDRKPACEASTGQRCRCLERLDCGGKQDEPF